MTEQGTEEVANETTRAAETGFGELPTSMAVAPTFPYYDRKKWSLSDWLWIFEARAEMHRITEDRMKILWCGAFVGRAGEGILTRLDPGTTWEAAKTTLLRKLGEGTASDEAWNRLKDLRRGGRSITELGSEVENLTSIAYAGHPALMKREAMEAFYRALQPNMAYELRKTKHETMEDLIASANRLEVLEKECNRKETGTETAIMQEQIRSLRAEIQLQKAPQKEAPSEMDIMREEIRALKAALQQQNRAPQEPPMVAKAQSSSQGRRRMRCFLCEEEGHMVRECPYKKSAMRQVRQNGGRQQDDEDSSLRPLLN